MAGIFYGIGVGPGDPELLTLKAFKVLSASETIAVPRASSDGDGTSQALQIVKKALDVNGKDILELHFPMTKDRDVLISSRREAALMIAGKLKTTDVAFITLGDPMLYSTFSYLVPFLKEAVPDLRVKVIPGITSFCAASSALALPLAESDEKVIIIPAAYDLESVKEAVAVADTVVLMKVNRSFDRILELLISLGISEKAFLITRAGWPGEEVVTDIKTLKGRKLDYFSTLIVRKNG